MKFTDLQVTNFRSHKQTRVQLDRLTVIRGDLASGKSSIQYAIEWLLTGRVSVTGDGLKVTDADGKGSRELMRDETQEMSVSALLEGGGKMRATLSAAKGVRNFGVADLSIDFVDTLKANREVLSCLCNNRYFLHLNPDRQKLLLSSLVLPAQYEFELASRNDCAECGIVVNWALQPFEVIASVYGQAFEKRTLVNRDLKAAVIPSNDQDPPAHTEEEARTRIHELNRQRTDLLVAKKDRLTAHTTAAQAWTSAIDIRDGMDAKIAREEEAEAQAKAQVRSKKQVSDLEAIAKNAAAVTALDTELIELVVKTGALEEKGKHLANLSSKCPLCFQQVTEELLERLIEPIRTELEAYQRRRSEAIAERKKLGDPALAQRTLEEHKHQAETLVTVQAKLEQLRAERAEVKVPAAPGPAPDTKDLDDALELVEKKTTQGSEILTGIVRYNAIEKFIREAKARRDSLVGELERLERLCTYFGKDGIKAKLIADYIGEFELAINKTLAKFGYYSKLQLEPEYGFLVTRWTEEQGERQSARTLALEQLSGSERYRFSVAFQAALAVHSEYGFVVVDGADILGDEKTSNALYRALYSEKSMEQAIVLSTFGIGGPTTAAPGAIYIDLKEGEDGTMVSVLRHNVAESVGAR